MSGGQTQEREARQRREYQAEYRRKNLERLKEYDAAYKQKNRDKINEYARQYRTEHPEKYEATRINTAINFLRKRGYTVIAPEEKPPEKPEVTETED
nr:MAG TPA: hypothetical protein [Caudoviricetes sp.]